ncbi:MAG: response regulator [Bacteroidetes bacterium]|nr:MAG: response regulator [Bacteroidota bacterium]
MNIKTLIIDDDDISVMLTDILFEDSPFANTTISFSDGVFALEYLKAEYCDDNKYIIILDINMPKMDGWEFLQHIKDIVSPSNTLVFMLSSSTDKLDIEKAATIELVKDYFSKPLTEEHLDKIIECTNN